MIHAKNLPSVDGCMCDNCITARAIEKRQAASQQQLSDDYIARRGGLDRPANVKEESK